MKKNKLFGNLNRDRRSKVPLVITALVAVIGFAMAACDTGNGPGNGKGPSGGNTAINIAAIAGVTAPVQGATPVTAITANAQYTGTVTWNGTPAAFAYATSYTATITVTAKSGYTLQGVSANFFTVAGATSVSNAANSGVITAVFPQTADDPNLSTLTGTITISPNNGVTTGTELTATYSGSEAVSFQWKKGGDNVGTASTANPNKYTPTEEGTYSVTVSLAGYNPKTSDPVTVTAGGITETSFSVSGKFNKAGGEEVKFSLRDAASSARSARSARAVTAESYAVSGELEDGDIVFRLSGTYDPVGLSYTASASSSLIRYSINGAFDEDGNSLGSTATLLVRNSPTSDDWSAFSYVIDETAAVAITGTPTTEVVTGGIPAGAQGWWSFSYENEITGSVDGPPGETYTVDARVLFSQWTIDQETVTTTQSDGTKEFDSMRASVVEAENKGSYYDVIMGYPVYKATDAHARAAFLQYLSENNLTAEERDSWPTSNWNPDPPWIQEWREREALNPEPLPPWLESLGNWNAVWSAKNNGTLPAIPSQYQEWARCYNHLYDTDFQYQERPRPWLATWDGQGEEPLPPWLNTLGSWAAINSAKDDGTLPLPPPEYQEWVHFYNYLYGNSIDYSFTPPNPPWLENWNPEREPLPPWLSSFADWDAVNATQYYDIPAIPSQYQQYAYLYNHLYGTDFEQTSTSPVPPWLGTWDQQGEQPLPPWLQSFGSWQAVYATAKFNLPAIPSQYQEHAWYYNHLYGTDFRPPRPPQDTTPPFYIIEDGWVMYGGTFAPNALNKWYNGNYLERYLIALGTTPDTVYNKFRLSYTSTSITIGNYYTGFYILSTFDTVAEARAATSIDTENSTTLTR